MKVTIPGKVITRHSILERKEMERGGRKGGRKKKKANVFYQKGSKKSIGFKKFLEMDANCLNQLATQLTRAFLCYCFKPAIFF